MLAGWGNAPPPPPPPQWQIQGFNVPNHAHFFALLIAHSAQPSPLLASWLIKK